MILRASTTPMPELSSLLLFVALLLLSFFSAMLSIVFGVGDCEVLGCYSSVASKLSHRGTAKPEISRVHQLLMQCPDKASCPLVTSLEMSGKQC